MSRFHTGTCKISDDWTFKDMRVVWMENDLIRVGILVGRGSDIFEFTYKPIPLDFMLRLKKEIHNPQQVFPQLRDTSNQMEDYYYGGWQEVLPNSLASIYRGASLGQHGEIWMLPWKHALIETGPDKISLKLWTRPLRMPLRIEKILTLKSGSAALQVEEVLTNESRTHLDVMWGHHIAFGLPFLKAGGTIETNAESFHAECNMPTPRKYKPGIQSPWPIVRNVDDEQIDASIIPPETAEPYADLAYLSGYGQDAFYTIKDQSGEIGFTVRWNGEIFKYLWYWQERYATQDAPWWGDAYAIALEPWTSMHPSDPQAAISNRSYLRLEAGTRISTKLSAAVFDKKSKNGKRPR